MSCHRVEVFNALLDGIRCKFCVDREVGGGPVGFGAQQ